MSPEMPNVPEELDAFVTALRVERNYSEHTIRSYRTDLVQYAGWCGRASVDLLQPGKRTLRAYLGHLNASGYARGTVNRKLSSLKSFYSWLAVTERTAGDPSTAIAGMKRHKRLPRKISPEEMTRILAVHGPTDAYGGFREQDAADLRDQAVLELLYASGCRISEAAGLSVEDIDFPRKRVKVFGKGAKERLVPIHDISATSLRTWLERGRPRLESPGRSGRSLFLSNRGNPYSAAAMRKMFKETLALAGVAGAYTPHDMRHTFASDLLEGGADLRSVQELLGHASPSTTQIYTHLSPGYLKDIHRHAHPRA